MQLIRTITNEPLYHEILGNGLPVYILQKPGFQKSMQCLPPVTAR